MGDNYDKLYIIIILGLIGAFVYWFQTQKDKVLYCSRCKNKVKPRHSHSPLRKHEQKKVRFNDKEEFISDNQESIDSLDSADSHKNNDDISIDM
jgi:uncharacterized protein HemX